MLCFYRSLLILHFVFYLYFVFLTQIRLFGVLNLIDWLIDWLITYYLIQLTQFLKTLFVLCLCIMHLDITTEDIRWNCLHNKQAVGGRPPRYAPVQACDGSAQRSLEPGRSANTRYQPAGRTLLPPTACTRQTSDVRQTSDSIIA